MAFSRRIPEPLSPTVAWVFKESRKTTLEKYFRDFCLSPTAAWVLPGFGYQDRYDPFVIFRDFGFQPGFAEIGDFGLSPTVAWVLPGFGYLRDFQIAKKYFRDFCSGLLPLGFSGLSCSDFVRIDPDFALFWRFWR